MSQRSGRGGGVKPVGTKSQVYPKKLLDGSPKLMAAQETRDRFIVEEEELNNARNGMSKDMEEQDQSSEEGSESEDAVEEEGEEDE